MLLFTKIFKNSFVLPLIKNLILISIFFSISRIIFTIHNIEHFKKVSIVDFVAGIYFDLVTIFTVGIPIILMWALTIPYKNSKIYQKSILIISSVINSVCLAVNLIDTEYFAYILKRTTTELFHFVNTGNEATTLVKTFASDFWYWIVVWIALTITYYILHKKWIKYQSVFNNWLSQIVLFIITLGITIIGIRGGVQLRPIGMVEASQFASTPQNVNIILNTPFTIIKSIGKNTLSEKKYFENKIAKEYFNPNQIATHSKLYNKNMNVVILILEGFGIEFVSKYGYAEKQFTPFLDSLLDNSLYFENGMANGRTSMESVPSILSSIPSLLDEPYLNSVYENNTIYSLASTLKDHQYYSAFFHGATNGSMRFDAYAKKVGFDQYFGRSEYNNEAHYDGNWGIFDEYFNPWAAEKISTLPEPFLATLFTLSSHHPYTIPEHMKNNVVYGKHPVGAAISYADHALRLFFEKAAQQSWYNNTIFVICADHSPAGDNELFKKDEWAYRIPIAFYTPNGQIHPEKNTTIFQQTDIYPTIMDMLGYINPYYAFGQSFYNNQTKWHIAYNNHLYFFTIENTTYTIQNDKVIQSFNWDNKQYNVDTLNQDNWNIYKSIIQQYNNDLIHNQSYYKNEEN